MNLGKCLQALEFSSLIYELERCGERWFLNSLREAMYRGLIDFRERSLTQPLALLSPPSSPGSKSCWEGSKMHQTHKALTLRIGKAATFVHFSRPKILAFSKKPLSLMWWMRCLREINVTGRCYTEWRMGLASEKAIGGIWQPFW